MPREIEREWLFAETLAWCPLVSEKAFFLQITTLGRSYSGVPNVLHGSTFPFPFEH